MARMARMLAQCLVSAACLAVSSVAARSRAPQSPDIGKLFYYTTIKSHRNVSYLRYLSPVMHRNDKRTSTLGNLDAPIEFLKKESDQLYQAISRIDKKLLSLSGNDSNSVPSSQYTQTQKPRKKIGGLSKGPIHIMIDNSNLWLGFNKVASRLNVPSKIVSLNYNRLKLLLQQGRKVDRCVVVASEAQGKIATLRFFNALGWTRPLVELYIIPRVIVGTSKSSKRKEQGVDEVLQVQMLLSLLDSPPKTLVLVTGDGNLDIAQGFPGIVARAVRIPQVANSCSWTSIGRLKFGRGWRPYQLRTRCL